MRRRAADVVQRFYDALAAHDDDATYAVLSESIEWYMAEELPWGGRFHGRAGVRRYLERMGDMVEKGEMDDVEMLDSGEHLVVTGTWRSRAIGGKEFAEEFANVFSIENDEIKSFVGHHNTARILEAFSGE